DSFDVTLRPTEPPALLETRPDPVEASRWIIRSLDVGPDHMAALAVEGVGWRLETMQWRTGSSSFSRSSKTLRPGTLARLQHQTTIDLDHLAGDLARPI